jgi:hypothetical protein
MLLRCTDPTHKFYSDYGGRGITVCPEWQTFEGFLADMGLRPVGLQLDRRENDRGYCKENCRWVTPLVQANNKRNNVNITLKGETLSMSQWSRRLGIGITTIHWRVRAGWPAERVLS